MPTHAAPPGASGHHVPPTAVGTGFAPASGALTAASTSGGASLGVLFAGNVEKQNPYSGVFKKRFLVLTQEGVHWFKRADSKSWFGDKHNLFGEERGNVPLSQVLTVRILDEDLVSFELQSTDFNKRIFKCATEANCEEWVSAIRGAVRKHAAHERELSGEGKGKAGAGASHATKLQRRMSITGAFGYVEEDEEEDTAGEAAAAAADVQVLVVSLISARTKSEVVLTRNPTYKRLIRIPVMRPNDEVIITLSNGGTITLTQDQLVYKAEIAGEFEASIQNVLVPSSLKIKLRIEEVPEARNGGTGGSPRGKNNKNTSQLTAFFDALLTLSESASSFTSLYVLVVIAVVMSGRALVMFWSLPLNSSISVFTLAFLCLSLAGNALNSLVKSYEKDGTRGAKYAGATTICMYILEHQYTSPDAPAMEPEEEIPQRFIVGCDGDLKEARRRWDITRKWRESERVDQVLLEEQPHFFTIKTLWPHYVCSRGRLGHPMWLERPGDIEADQLKARGITPDILLRHWIFITEYLWKYTAPDPMAKSISVIDINNIRMGDIGGENLDFIRKTISIANMHYPERAYVIFIVNAPSWFSWIWKLLKPFVHENTQKKVKILSKKEILPGLLEHVEMDEIPIYYGGKKDFGGFDSCRFSSPDEVKLAEYVRSLSKHSAPPSGLGDDETSEPKEPPIPNIATTTNTTTTTTTTGGTSYSASGSSGSGGGATTSTSGPALSSSALPNTASHPPTSTSSHAAMAPPAAPGAAASSGYKPSSAPPVSAQAQVPARIDMSPAARSSVSDVSGISDITMDSPMPQKKSWRESLGFSSSSKPPPTGGGLGAAQSSESQAYLKQSSASFSSAGKLFARDDGMGAYIPDMFDDVGTNQ